MRKICTLLLLVFSALANAQIVGKIKDAGGNELAFVNVILENTYNSTTSNDQGNYELNVKNTGRCTIVFQYLGFKTVREVVDITKFPFELNITLTEDSYALNEVLIDPKVNPADAMIRSAIKAKSENAEQSARFRADFYSRGIFRIKDMPKTLLGQKLDMFDDMLDSTRSGILYLSETVSKITFQKPDKMKEVIVASKVSGNDNGFSFNNAASANFDFYENFVPIGINVISPIADNAFSYYKYKFEGSVFDEKNRQINKIKVTPKRDSEPAMEGYIYLVDDSWAIYAIELSITGRAMQNPAVDQLTVKQSFSYNATNAVWIKNTQTLDFVAGIFGINISGRFTYVYNNFEFEELFVKGTFSREVLSFETDANKKDDNFWDKIRPVPLTEEETTDYLKKDILQTKKKSQAYLDSTDRKSNKLGVFDIVSGYSHRNSYKHWSVNYDGLLLGIGFNTVQGWNLGSGVSFTARNEENQTYSYFGTKFNYGFADDRFRGSATFTRKFDNVKKNTLSISAGNTVAQFNSANPIGVIGNTISTLYFKNNFMKLYERNFAAATFSTELTNGIFANLKLDYSERLPLYNQTDYVLIKRDKDYTSNNPLLPYDYDTPAITKHNLVKATLAATFNFGQEYITRPDGKYNMRNEKFPAITVGVEKGLGGSEKKYEYEHLFARLYYETTIGNKGIFALNSRFGKFFNSDQISFVDYKHFNGNQTHVGTSDRYLSVYNLLPYYSASTNDSYVEIHAEHDDKGFVTNKIPLLRKLQSTLVLGYHSLMIPHRNPYHEFTIGLDNLGFGKFRMFRFDYVRSYQNGFQGDGVIFGIKILGAIE